mmetsp:Transcript_17387/g.29383  ORF Transcript_17387/g.29383 Transcript_17387/m.29383 type:complete len:174 (-) Transcript_17387:183-704(-)|eukprot:CAMPEP_0174975594 /NCGR_PEP_ID=MMETSP0004_2-20121128/12534_1 /TAXON_ID=420556 /ORGANISM="Ochromonas sp., Strain CCMP1393" /LENGTH=173 /DNA_ID=CAMNT_0016226471 /DNA_START=95 /DNA_END=616 /DNA_ORIENTATION=-
MSDMEEARKAMIAKRFGGNKNGASTGGTGSVRRKNKGSAKSGADDKKLSGVLKKLALTDIKGVEEVNIFKGDGSLIHITSPKIQASIPSNTYVIGGITQNKRVEELLPGILAQLGPESMEYLRQYAEGMKTVAGGGAAGLGSEPIAEVGEEDDDDDDDEVPDLVENFEEAAAK